MCNMDQFINTHQFDNGLVLIAEQMDWLESAALTLLVPVGCAHDPDDLAGLSNFTCEMVQRGCGGRSSREFVEALENLGVDRMSAVSNAHTSYGGAMPAQNLESTLSIYADLLRHPLLPGDQLEEGLQVCLQEVRAVEDDPAQRVMLQLRKQHYAAPWGRSSYGNEHSLRKISIENIGEHFQRTYRAQDCILSVAGNIDWNSLRDCVTKLLGDWDSGETEPIQEQPTSRKYHHISTDSTQTHIAIAYDSVPYPDPEYFQARGAVGVLSDGMSSRLFTEVRERRGLCYTVYATMHSLLDRGAVFCYAGTSTERAQETLDVIIAELMRLPEGIRPEELERLKARVKSSLIMQQESSRGRSASLASDWYFLGRLQTIDEIGRVIDGLTCDSINAYLQCHPPRDFTVVTLGAQPLEVPLGVS